MFMYLITAKLIAQFLFFCIILFTYINIIDLEYTDILREEKVDVFIYFELRYLRK